MSKRDKLRRKLRNNPKGRTKQEIETLLGYFGFELERVSGSHHLYTVQIRGETYRLVVPIHGREIKPFYIKQALDLIDELFPLDTSLQDDSDE